MEFNVWNRISNISRSGHKVFSSLAVWHYVAYFAVMTCSKAVDVLAKIYYHGKMCSKKSFLAFEFVKTWRWTFEETFLRSFVEIQVRCIVYTLYSVYKSNHGKILFGPIRCKVSSSFVNSWAALWSLWPNPDLLCLINCGEGLSLQTELSLGKIGFCFWRDC